ncbi:MAG TPA: TlpA disulfide reductase family protein [Polyangia bacterium]|nr:TlpA disulfide reductase family protein [Polyangia bacterium]
MRQSAPAPARALALTLTLALVAVSACGRGLSPRVDDPAAAAPAPAAVEPAAHAAVEPAAAAPTPRPSPRAPRAVGAAPGYTLMDLEAIEHAVRGRGHPLLVHFWASWCGPCLQELPLLDKFARDMRARGVEVLSLSLDDPERAGGQVVEVLAARAPNLTRNIVRVQDTSSLINTIDPRWEGSIPAMFAYDSKGRLRDSLIGETTRRDLDVLIARAVNPGRK